PLSRNILRRPRVILQVSHESKKIKFKHTIRGVDVMKNYTKQFVLSSSFLFHFLKKEQRHSPLFLFYCDLYRGNCYEAI
ncbi:hypothetical protein BMT17_23045, partial [Bacillus thuringiensis serovar kurstaki]